MANPWLSRRQAVLGAAAVPLALSLAPKTAHAHTEDSAARKRIELDDGWEFRFGERPEWNSVQLPHTWNAQDGQDGGDDYLRGPGWYRRTLRLPPESAGGRVFLQFDGANTVTDAWLNEVHLGQHRGGYTRFRFDITEAWRPDSDNELVVRVDNAKDPDVAPLSADFTFGGGLYRSVSLHVTDPVHLDLLDFGGPGIYLRQRAVNAAAATVEITAKLANDTRRPTAVRVRTVLTGADGRTAHAAISEPVALEPGARATSTTSLRIGSPKLWRGRADPHLYRARVEVRDARTDRLLDELTQPLGLRTFDFSATDGFALNGTHLQLRGVNRHQDRRDEGFALARTDHEQDFALMHEMGVNALRTAHYPQDEAVYDLADELGFVVYTEVPWVNELTDTDAFRANVVQQLRELIRQHYNHPSVLVWGIGNELGFDQKDKDPQTNALLAELAEVVRTEDPERVSGYANVLKRADDDPFTSHADLSGYNRYEGWYEGTHTDFGRWADELHARDPQRKIGVTEYGAGANIHHHAEPSSTPPQHDGPWHPEEYQSVLHESYLEQINARPYLWGTFLWNMFDFASDDRAEGEQPGINDKGLVTHDRTVRKDAFFWYRANWTATPVVHITSKRWTERSEPDTTIRVYSNGEHVTLTVNGERLPTERGGRLFTRRVHLQPGTNTITAETTINGEPHTDTAQWTHTPR